MSETTPEIELVTPNLALWGEITTELHDPIPLELANTLRDFYDSTLIPEIVCSPDSGVDRPDGAWLSAEDRKAVLCYSGDGTLIGCWILKGHGIYYPCVNVMKGARGVLPILRHLAYRSFEEEGEELYALTDNALINAWVDRATDTPEEGRPANMPLAKPLDGRIEWRS